MHAPRPWTHYLNSFTHLPFRSISSPRDPLIPPSPSPSSSSSFSRQLLVFCRLFIRSYCTRGIASRLRNRRRAANRQAHAPPQARSLRGPTTAHVSLRFLDRKLYILLVQLRSRLQLSSGQLYSRILDDNAITVHNLRVQRDLALRYPTSKCVAKYREGSSLVSFGRAGITTRRTTVR